MDFQSQFEYSVSKLPFEVTESVFKYLDARSLVVCKRVCRLWKDQINYLEKNLIHLWFELCQNEIPNWAQFDLLDKVYPCHWKNKTDVDWQVIYKCWYFWQNNYKKPIQCEILGNIQLSGISSIKQSGKWLLISTYHGKGALKAWSPEKSSFLTIYQCCDGLLGFELVNTDSQIPCDCKGVTEKHTQRLSVELEDFFDSIDHNEIWVEMTDCYARLGKTFVFMIDKLTQRISHSYGYEIRHVSESGQSVLYFNKTCDTVSGPEAMEVDLTHNYKSMVQCWMNKVCLLNDDSIGQIKIDTITVNMKSQMIKINSGSFPGLGNFRLYSWQNSIYVIFSDKRQLLFFTEKNKSASQEVPLRKGVITAVFFYVGYLFLGNDRGELMVYKLSSPEDCLSLAVYQSDPWTIQLNPKKQVKIIHITVIEPKNLGKKPSIVCATSEEIYWISFPERKL